mmetsp:Transcript_13719/g.43097  ORF Transcript_13719/g.43097 Transcript_13719/m.43097 type:complete len:264 (+) Transcript_13719:512-1303(+)
MHSFDLLPITVSTPICFSHGMLSLTPPGPSPGIEHCATHASSSFSSLISSTSSATFWPSAIAPPKYMAPSATLCPAPVAPLTWYRSSPAFQNCTVGITRAPSCSAICAASADAPASSSTNSHSFASRATREIVLASRRQGSSIASCASRLSAQPVTPGSAAYAASPASHTSSLKISTITRWSCASASAASSSAPVDTSRARSSTRSDSRRRRACWVEARAPARRARTARSPRPRDGALPAFAGGESDIIVDSLTASTSHAILR